MPGPDPHGPLWPGRCCPARCRSRFPWCGYSGKLAFSVAILINIILPVFGLILIGYIAGHTSILPALAVRGMAHAATYLMIPVLLFRSREDPADMDDDARRWDLLVPASAEKVAKERFGRRARALAKAGAASPTSTSTAATAPG